MSRAVDRDAVPQLEAVPAAHLERRAFLATAFGTSALITVVSVGHRPELEAFHTRKLVLEYRRDERACVWDAYARWTNAPVPDSLLAFSA